MKITAAARSSPLSRAQVTEIPFNLDVTFVETVGDIDQKTSLRSLGKTDFFTREVDELVLNGSCRIGIHSAKDLPEPLTKGLTIAALTLGVDSSDSLVIEREPVKVVATSSERRELAVREVLPDVEFIDLRGTIQQRLDKLKRGEADAAVIAEAAFIRLNLTHLKRVKLPGETVPLQGQLAITCREDDKEMLDLFKSLDTRKELYLGLECPDDHFIHCPMIKIKPGKLPEIPACTHIILTSKTTVRLLGDKLPKNVEYVVVGESTAHELRQKGIEPRYIAKEECAEGIIRILPHDPHAKYFWPHSVQARPVLKDYFKDQLIEYSLYETLPNKCALPHLYTIKTIHFTSPSVVESFFAQMPSLPYGIQCLPIGPITACALKKYNL